MTGTGGKIARWAVRFVIAAMIYIAIATFWIKNATGWASLGLFVAAIVFGAIAAVTWCVAIAIAQLGVRNLWARAVAQAVLATVLFAISAVVGVAGFLGDDTAAAWRDVGPFVGLVAGCAAVDAAVGIGLERRSAPATRPAS